ncbi:MAG: hypothetical protein JO303_06200 [Caulobacteraceae bacterium]|nr:hypothetical protein [Caulobacteraceae bacterium]
MTQHSNPEKPAPKAPLPQGQGGGTYGQKDIGRSARSTDAMTTRAGDGIAKGQKPAR